MEIRCFSCDGAQHQERNLACMLACLPLSGSALPFEGHPDVNLGVDVSPSRLSYCPHRHDLVCCAATPCMYTYAMPMCYVLRTSTLLTTRRPTLFPPNYLFFFATSRLVPYHTTPYHSIPFHIYHTKLYHLSSFQMNMLHCDVFEIVKSLPGLVLLIACEESKEDKLNKNNVGFSL